MIKLWDMICEFLREVKTYRSPLEFFFWRPPKNGYTLEEIVEGMKEVPYENIKDKLPIEFAIDMRKILNREEEARKHKEVPSNAITGFGCEGSS